METKICAYCSGLFSRPSKISSLQWYKRIFCSKKCSATKRKLTDEEIYNLYLDGFSSNELSKIINVSGAQVLRIIRNIGNTRSPSEAHYIAGNRKETKQKMSAANTGRPCKDHVKEILRNRIGEKNHNWKGGKTSNGGYTVFTASPVNGDKANKGEHRVLMEEHVGRKLNTKEHVHHINGIKDQNDLGNLQILWATDHARYHAIINKLGHRK